MFECKDCGSVLPASEYYYNSSGGRNHACKLCIKKKNVEKYKNNPELSEKRKERQIKYAEDPKWLSDRKRRSSNFYSSLRGRAMTLFKSAKRREGNFEESIDFDYIYILEKLKIGKCEVTGLTFDFDKPENTAKNPYSPSIDRIDSSKGYYKDNVRIVIWQYNLMKGEISDEELLNLCRIVVNEQEQQERLGL